jgi:hypothetical protein
MIRDVFYYGNKPNAHPREKHAVNLADARQQCTSEHFWIINEYCDYTNFDWDWEFDFLPDDEVWTSHHNNVWPSQYQKDSGTWLCTEEHSDIIIYRADVAPIVRKNIKNNNWIILDDVDETKFNFSWHPDPSDPPYIYKWGCKFHPVEVKSYLEYHVKGATTVKYMSDVIELLPELTKWVEIQPVATFDFTWRPDPREPSYIYTWGNKHIDATIKPTLEYHCDGATERKYMDNNVAVLPEWDKWVEVQSIDKSTFDFSWRPDPREPAYIYTWGNKHIDATLQPTLEYHVEGATERKYMDNNVGVLTEWDKWVEVQPVDKSTFDFTWRPDPREPAYIYTWGNKHISAELQPTLEYHCPGATERKYMDNNVGVLTEWDKWVEVQPVDKSTFDFSWRPDPNEPAYIYTWGNKYISAELKPTLEYHCFGATERKYMDNNVDVLPEWDKWVEVQAVDKELFDFSWRPDPREPAYIYTWGNKYISAELKSTLEYHVEGATERKYMDNNVSVLPEWDKWKIWYPIDKSTFDFSWRPDPREPAYMYVFGNTQYPGEIMPTVQYDVSDATEYKFIQEHQQEIKLLPNSIRFEHLEDSHGIDYSWYPNPLDPPYIYAWGNQWNKPEDKISIQYVVKGATEYKYMEDRATRKPCKDNWETPEYVIKSSFDYSWEPDLSKYDPPYIYQFGTIHQKTNGPRYIVPGATEVKYIDDIKAKVVPWQLDSWVIPANVDKKSFDFSWHPDATEPAYIYQFPSTWDKIGGPKFVVPGATETKYMEYPIAKVKPDMTRWFIPSGLDTSDFDLSWHPDVNDEPYIYQFGTQWQKTNGPVYTALGSTVDTPIKYMDLAEAKRLTDKTNWDIPKNIKEFDFSWHPDATEPAYIYQFPSTWDKIGGPTYIANGATDIKYMDYPIAKLNPNMTHWSVPEGLDTSDFDFSWHPDINDEPLIYHFGTQWQKTNGPVYTTPGCTIDTLVKYLDLSKAKRLADKTNWIIPAGFDETKFDFSWHPDATSPSYIYQFGTLLEDVHLQDGPKYITPGNDGHVVLLENIMLTDSKIQYPHYYIETTLEALIEEHKDEIFWALRKNIDYTNFDFEWQPTKESAFNINTFGSPESETTQTYLVNGKMWQNGYRDLTFIENTKLDEEYLSKLFKQVDAFFVDKGNKESAVRFEQLKLKFPNITKTRYLNSWVDTINRCINKSTTDVCWILNSELDYDNFDFNYYPNPWQMKMVHVFGTQWSHWGSTFMVNKETFAEDTKYVKIIEHLSNLNFVKTKRAFASNCLYDVYLIDYGNDTTNNITSLLENKTKRTVEIINYEGDYLTTLKNMLHKLDNKKDHYIWICSSICDYTSFDFTYICDPFSLEQLHVFPSDLQKFGDTFFVNVNNLRILVEDLDKLENIEKINFNQHQRVTRLPSPNFITESDTHVSITTTTFNWPYATFITYDNKEINVVDHEPISMWSKEAKNILITSTGGTRIIVPKEANDYVEKELYDYPYISKSSKLVKSKPLDIVFLSNGEPGADENYEHLLNVTKNLPNCVVRVDGVTGRVAAYHAAADASSTPWMFTVFAKLKVDNKFDFSWQPDRLQVPKHYIFHATNPVNNLEYGHQAMIAYNKQITLSNMGKGLDFTLDNEHEVVDINSGIAVYNTDEFSTWRTSFREAIKLRLEDSTISRHRLKVWSTVGEGDFAQYSIQGAQHAVEYYESVNGELDKLRLSYDWPWLQEYFNTKYN